MKTMWKEKESDNDSLFSTWASVATYFELSDNIHNRNYKCSYSGMFFLL